MCEHCEDINILITDPMHKSNKKYDKAVEIIEKALGYSTASGASEIMPYRSVREHIKQTKEDVEKRLLRLHNEILKRWLQIEFEKAASDPFKLSGKIVLNPRTGKPLTKSEWATIKKDLMRAFAYVYGGTDAQIARTAMALGRIIADLPVSAAINTSLGNMKLGQGIRIVDTDPQYRASMQFAEDRAAENIVDLTNRQYKAIHDVIVTAQQNRVSPRQLESDLFHTFGEMNRDWRRIAETEIATNVNNAALITELARERVDGDYVYMKGLSSPRACKWCWSEVHNKVFVLLDAPPTGGGDQVEIDGKTFTAIWPNKSNVGRARRDWWVASGTQHPHCQCTFVRYTPGYEKYFEKFEAAMAQASEAARNEFYPTT